MTDISEPADRLIVAADFIGAGRQKVRKTVLDFADKIAETGVYLKVNSILRAIGYDLIDELHARQLKVFADLKLNDIMQTMRTDGSLLQETKPDILTAMCSAGPQALRALKTELPGTEVLGVTVLTSLKEEHVEEVHGRSIVEQVQQFAGHGVGAGLDGLVCSAKEVPMLREIFGDNLSLNTPGIRPEWSLVAGDDQNPDRVMTPAAAIAAGATRLVIGRPIVQADSPLDAVNRTLEEIAGTV